MARKSFVPFGPRKQVLKRILARLPLPDNTWKGLVALSNGTVISKLSHLLSLPKKE